MEMSSITVVQGAALDPGLVNIESGIGKIAHSQSAGLIATTGAAVTGHRDFIIKLAAQHRLPTVYPHRTWADRGGLLSYGSDLVASARLAARYVDRILRGGEAC